MQFPSRRARVALLTGCATLGVAGTASATSVVYTTDTNVLQITVDDATGTDKITCVGGKVKLNDTINPTRTPDDGKPDTGCAASVGLTVDEPDKTTASANTLDLRGITRAEWTGLAASATPFSITMGGGNDTVFGTEFADTIAPGNGDDAVHGDDGADTMIWRPGEKSDVMTGGDGKDTVLDEGGNVDEQFVVKPKDGDPTRVDASRINNPFTLDIDAEKLVINGNGGNDSITGSVGLAALIKTEMNGGDGNDVLVGTDGDDVQKGGTGNDSITGARGDDDMDGDDGDDLMVWNPGDGSDTMDGAAGNDTAQDNGGAAAEHFIVSANGQRVTATRDSGAPFFLDIATTETLDLNTAGGDDSVDVNNGLGALIKVDVDLGEGNDSIRARNDSAQVVDGGAGTDTAQADATDVVTNVEALDAGADAKKPKAKFLQKRLKAKRGFVNVRLSCPAGETVCKGNLRIIRNKKTIAKTAIDMKGGETEKHRVRLNRGVRARLAEAKGNKLPYLFRATVRDSAGNKGVTKKTLQIKLAR